VGKYSSCVKLVLSAHDEYVMLSTCPKNYCPINSILFLGKNAFALIGPGKHVKHIDDHNKANGENKKNKE
jgi:hypothetical protein